ncbi:hypothetical protein AV521_36170 [Streptomyces sp. IMTB 2501]|nr:hypothetical protein AV521_36170 [Streptomyces sp. IMTB 2501]
MDDLHAFISDPAIDAVVCAGGGKNANWLLRGLDYGLIAARPKPIVGVSDPSLLLNAITARTGMPTFHGPAVLWDWGSGDSPAATGPQFTAVLAGDGIEAIAGPAHSPSPRPTTRGSPGAPTAPPPSGGSPPAMLPTPPRPTPPESCSGADVTVVAHDDQFPSSLSRPRNRRATTTNRCKPSRPVIGACSLL